MSDDRAPSYVWFATHRDPSAPKVTKGGATLDGRLWRDFPHH